MVLLAFAAISITASIVQLIVTHEMDKYDIADSVLEPLFLILMAVTLKLAHDKKQPSLYFAYLILNVMGLETGRDLRS